MDSRTNLHDVLPRQLRFIAKRAEDRVLSVEQVQRSVEFCNLAPIHDEYAVVVYCLTDQQAQQYKGEKEVAYRWCSAGGRYIEESRRQTPPGWSAGPSHLSQHPHCSSLRPVIPKLRDGSETSALRTRTRTMIRLFFTNARQRARSCFSPAL